MTNLVDIRKRNQAAEVMKLAGFSIAEQAIQLGRVIFNDNADYAKVSGYVLFFVRTVATDIPDCIRKQLALAPDEEVVVAVKAFKNEHNVERQALFFKAGEINWDKTRSYAVGSCFKALCSTDWKYAEGAESPEIIEEKEYRRLMLAKRKSMNVAV